MGKEQKYASHLPVFEELFKMSSFSNVLEFGCGNYSTKFFIDNCDKVTSIENWDEKWYNKIKKEIKNSKHTLLYSKGIKAIDYLKNNYYDLIFVDADKRQECINASFGRTSVIVVHDLDRKNINRGFLKGIINNNYILFMANIAHPATSIFTNDRYLIEKLNNSNTFTKIDQTEFVEVFFGKK